MSESVKQTDSNATGVVIYGTTEQTFFGSTQFLVGIITLFCSAILFALSGYEVMVKLLPYIPTFATLPLVFGGCVAIWLGIPVVLLLRMRTRVKTNAQNSGIRRIETMLKAFMLCLTLFAVTIFLILLFSGKITNAAVDWLLSQEDIIQKLEDQLPEINKFLAANEFITFKSIPTLLKNPDALMGIDIGIKAIFALLTLLSALTASLLKHAILSCIAIRKVLENADAPEEIPQRVSLFLCIMAIFGAVLAIIIGVLLGSVIWVLALLMLTAAQLAFATALKQYRDERLIEILNINKKKRGN